jgi:hypothetical protein
LWPKCIYHKICLTIHYKIYNEDVQQENIIYSTLILTLLLTASKLYPNPQQGDKKSQYSLTPHCMGGEGRGRGAFFSGPKEPLTVMKKGVALKYASKSIENGVFIENP